MTTDGPTAAADVARAANVANNAAFQHLRLARWAPVRDAVWEMVEPVLAADARVALVGAGNCDDLPLRRITERANHVDLVDFDLEATARAAARVSDALRARLRVIEDDVTSGCAATVLAAAGSGGPMPNALQLPHGPIGTGGYDLVVGDMLYSQLLHPGLISLGLDARLQHEVMRRYDGPLATMLVRRLQESAAADGHVLHLHDYACWSSGHLQPVSLDHALADPDFVSLRLQRHDECDPHLALKRIDAPVIETRWWEWPFEPNKRFLVRATLAGAGTRT